MKLEIHTRENEYNNNCMEISQSEEIYQNVQEVSIPKREIYTERTERISASDGIEDAERKKKKREEKEKLYKKLIRKMSYTAASVVAVVMILQTPGIGLQEDNIVVGDLQDNDIVVEDTQEDDVVVEDTQEDDVVVEDTQNNDVMDEDSIKDNVVAAGGSIDADLRFTIQWNDDRKNGDDLDAYCIQPDGEMLFFGNPELGTGSMDVDVTDPADEIAIENIVYKDKSEMADGIYTLFVHCYTDNAGGNGFKAQIEIDNQVYTFEYHEKLEEGDIVNIAEITLENGTFTIKELMEKQPYEE